ncbi:MAG: apolipoprotein N-acyltransferase [Acidimicrobiales bacterium]
MRRGRVALVSLAAGVLVALSLPPLGLWELGIVGLGVLAWRLGGLRPGARVLAGLMFGVGLFGPTLIWVTAFSAVGYVIVVGLEAAFFALASLAVPAGRGRSLVFPAVVTLASAARSAWPFGGLPMGGIVLGQAGGPLLGASRVGGPLLVTGLAALGGVCLAGLAPVALAGTGLAVGRGRPGGTQLGRAGSRCRPGAASILIGLVVVLTVALSATIAPDGGPAVAKLRVALVQGGGMRGEPAIDVNPAIPYDAQLIATADITEQVGLVLWPEDTIALYGPLAGSVQDQQLGALAQALGSTVVAGVTEDVGKTQFLNQAVAWGPSGKVIGSYEKVHRVPFGEYVPLRSILKHIVNLSAVPRDAIPGHLPGFLRTPAGPLGVMISYEVFFSNRARVAVQAGGELLVVPTNTSSYRSDQVPAQEEAADRMRAVEEGRDLVQASPTGYSTVVNSHGEVLDRSGLGVKAVIEATVAKRKGLTLYERGGDLPELLAAALAVLAGWAVGIKAARPG